MAAAAAAAPLGRDLAIGDRVRDKDGSRGTVRYLGPVATSKSADTVYAGIEWDDEGRGKNDGSVTADDGTTVRYFTCAPGQGSFLKLALVDRGLSVIEALRLKYRDPECRGGGTVTAESGEEVEIVFVGDDKVRAQQQLERLWNVSLKGFDVSYVDDAEIRASAPRLADLDLSDTLLTRWEDVAALGRALPRLATLNLSGNRFAHPATLPKGTTAALPGVRVLVLSGTGTSFAEVHSMAASGALPALQELHLCANGIRTLGASGEGKDDDHATPVDPASFASLTTLNLADNAIESWTQVWRLRFLPKLSTLIISDNRIAQVCYGPETMSPVAPSEAVSTVAARPSPVFELPTETPDAFAIRAATSCSDTLSATAVAADAAASGSSALPFARLESLTLSGNPLAEWSSVDELRWFPALRSLRAAGAGVVASLGPTQARLEIIARVGTLRSLNGSEVRPREREDAEKAYVRRVAKDAIAASPGASTFSAALATDVARLEAVAIALTCGEGAHDPASDEPSSAAPAGSDSSSGAGGVAAATMTTALPPAGLRLRTLHPRFFLLLLRHGELATLARSADTTGAGSTSASTVTVTIRSMAGASCMMDPITRSLPATMAVHALKQLAARAFKADVSLVRLSFRDAPVRVLSLSVTPGNSRGSLNLTFETLL